MQFTIIREKLLQPLQMVMGAVEKRQTMPILGNALLKISNQTLVVIATDLEVELHGFVTVDSVIEEGSTTVPARKLLDICRALPENKSISLVLKDDNLLISCEKSRFKLATLPTDDFPNVEEGVSREEFTIPQAQFKYLIDRVYFSMAQQDVRYYLNGMFLIKTPSTLRTVAADGHRLSLCSHQAQLCDGEMQAIIPRKAVMELLRLLNDDEGDISINIGENHLRIVGKGYTFISKLIDGVFPDYQKVIPKNADKSILIDKDILKQMLARISILSNEKYHGVNITIEQNKLALEAHNSEHEEAYEEIAINYSAEALELGFNVSYLLEAINALPKGNVRILLSDNNTSIQLEAEKGDGALYVIMPMRI